MKVVDVVVIVNDFLFFTKLFSWARKIPFILFCDKKRRENKKNAKNRLVIILLLST